MKLWSLIAMGMAIGAILPFQAGANTRFARAAESPIWGAVLNFSVGLCTLLLAVLIMRLPLPHGSKLGALPWWAWIGGLCGACFVAGTTYLMPRIGAVMVLVCAVTGQMVAALVVDHFGLLHLEPRPVSLMKIGGVLLLAGGVVMVRMG